MRDKELVNTLTHLLYLFFSCLTSTSIKSIFLYFCIRKSSKKVLYLLCHCLHIFTENLGDMGCGFTCFLWSSLSLFSLIWVISGSRHGLIVSSNNIPILVLENTWWNFWSKKMETCKALTVGYYYFFMHRGK